MNKNDFYEWEEVINKLNEFEAEYNEEIESIIICGKEGVRRVKIKREVKEDGRYR